MDAELLVDAGEQPEKRSRWQIGEGIKFAAPGQQSAHHHLQQHEHRSDDQRADVALIMSRSSRQHMLFHGQQVCLEKIQVNDGEQEENNGTHDLLECAIVMIGVDCHCQFFFNTTAERAGM